MSWFRTFNRFMTAPRRAGGVITAINKRLAGLREAEKSRRIRATLAFTTPGKGKAWLRSEIGPSLKKAKRLRARRRGVVAIRERALDQKVGAFSLGALGLGIPLGGAALLRRLWRKRGHRRSGQ